MDDYRNCYAVLGVPPDSDWESLRAQYKRLIGQWHPDRFAANTEQQRFAEERSKRITAAFQALEKYRREHGTLPPKASASLHVAAQGPNGDADSAPGGPHAEYRPATGGQSRTARARARRTPGRRRRLAYALLVLVVAVYSAHRLLDAWVSKDHETAEIAHESGIAPVAPGLAVTPGKERGISAGSTFGDVYAIQGIPTLTQGDTWHYGKSHIRFAHGKVISWTEDPGNPLRIARNQPVRMQGGTFRVGSIKDEVRATQGTPVTESATVWDYGLSRVYFEDNRVVRWEESPMQPLRVPH